MQNSPFFVVEDNEIKQYFIELLNNEIVEEVQTIFSPITKIYPWTGGLDEEFFENGDASEWALGTNLSFVKNFMMR